LLYSMGVREAKICWMLVLGVKSAGRGCGEECEVLVDDAADHVKFDGVEFGCLVRSWVAVRAEVVDVSAWEGKFGNERCHVLDELG
jgi:hypothetical protein